MKNILLVSDSFLKGGLESRIISQIEQLKKHHTNFYLACENLDESNRPLFKDILHLSNLQSLNNPNPPIKEIIKSRDLLIKFCKKNKIDFIDCQPFCCVLPAALCAQKNDTPISFTLHGVISGDFVDYKYPEIRILFYIAMKYGIDQIFAVAEYLEDLYSFLSPNIFIARNGTSFQKSRNLKQSNSTGKFAIASRLDMPKTTIIMDFLPLIHDLKNINSIEIYGNGDSKNLLASFIKNSNLSKVSLKGWSNTLISDIRQGDYDAVFGMGKVVLDALNANVPIGVLGYGGFAGFITPDSIKNFAKTNLTSWDQISTSKIKDAINEVQKHPEKFKLSLKDLSIFRDEQNWDNYFNYIKTIRPHNHQIIQHFNTVLDQYYKTNRQLHISKLIQKLDPLLQNTNDIFYKTLSMHNALENQISELTNTINVKDEIIAQKDTTIEFQKNELASITNSNFWKISKPIRGTLSALHRKRKTLTLPKSEIIAVLCVYNESLNIDGCLSHLEKYVDKIIIFDDGSTDQTVDIAQRHKKVIKIIKNLHKTFWNERKNRETVLREAFSISRKENVWALCVDADERLEQSFLTNLRSIIKKHENKNAALALHFRELWNDLNHYRTDGIWGQKRKAILFKLKSQMTFNYSQEHHIPWYYQELHDKEILLDYNIYHLKMIKSKDRKKRATLYNQLDPDKKMQPIGYDYLTDTTGIRLTKITQNQTFNRSTVPDYYK